MMPLITVGSFQLYTYVLVYSLAFFVFTSLTLRAVRGEDSESSRVRLGLISSAVAFMVGMILPGLIQSLAESLRTGQPLQPPQSRVYYGLAASLLVVVWVNRGRTLADIYRDLDRFIPYFPLAYAIGRLGCLAAGCCGGAETTSVLHMYMPDEHGHWANRYPTQLMSGGIQLALALLLFWLLRWRDRQQVKRGFVAWLNRPGVILYGYLIAFCLERFALDFLRMDYYPILGVFSLPQLLMLAGLGAAVAGLAQVKPPTHIQNSGKVRA
jgi:phosphatidylglycerol:prolipoprotein diacylglycerol transferase